MKNNHKLLILLFTLGFVLLGCGGGSKGEEETIKDIVISSTHSVFVIGKEYPLTANGVIGVTSKDVSAQVSWSSSDNSIATISSSGVVNPLAVGDVIFTASLEEVSGEKAIEVIDSPKVSEIKYSGVSPAVTEGDKFQISIELFLTDENTEQNNYERVTFSTSDEEVLSIDNEGNAEALSYGTTTLTIASKDSDITETKEITVAAKVIEVLPEPKVVYLNIGNPVDISLDVTAKFSDDSEEQVTSKVRWEYSKGDETNYKQNIDELKLETSGKIIANAVGTYYAQPKFDGLVAENSVKIIVEHPLEIISLNDSNQIKIVWTNKTDVSEYQLFWDNTGNISIDSENVNIEKFTDTNTFTLENVTSDNPYFFRVAFIRGNEELSALSPELRVQPLNGRWSKMPALPTLRDGAAGVVFENDIFIFGGNRINNEDAIEKTATTSKLNLDGTGEWKSRAPMPNPRSGMAACRHGEFIFVFGGTNTDGAFSDQILKYDPINDLWANVSSLISPTSNLSCNTVDDKIYLIGGIDDNGASNKVYTFDPASETTPPEPTINLNSARSSHASTVIGNTIYVAGGKNDTDTSPLFESFDVSSSTEWSILPQLEEYRANFGLVSTNGVIYAVGGETSADIDSLDVEMFDTNKTDPRWVYGPNMPYANSGFTYLEKDSAIYLFGGNNSAIEVSGEVANSMHLDVRLSNWHPNYNPLQPVTNFHSAILDQQIFVIGGSPILNEYIAETQSLDLETNIWSNSINGPRTPPSLPTIRSDMSTIVFRSEILAIGGIKHSSTPEVTNVVSNYDPSTNSWSDSSELKAPRKNACSAVVNNRLFVFGGFSGEKLSNREVIETAVELYDPINKSWVIISSWDDPRAGATCVSLNGLIYLLGGLEEIKDKGINRASTKVDVFDPNTLSFRTTPLDMGEARISPAVTTLNGAIFTFGGFKGAFDKRELLNTAERFVPLNEIDPDRTNERKALTNLPDYYHHIEAHTYKDKIVVIGSKVTDLETGLIDNIILTYE